MHVNRFAAAVFLKQRAWGNEIEFHGHDVSPWIFDADSNTGIAPGFISLRSLGWFAGVADFAAAGADGIQERLELLSKGFRGQPRGVDQHEKIDGSQFGVEAFEQFPRGIVQLGVAVLHVQKFAGKLHRAGAAVDSEQK
jgi:hypothetical protein